MKEDFVSFDLAKKLKEKGFYYKCVATYENNRMLGYNYIQPTNIRAIDFDDCLCSHNVENDGCIDAPTISQVLKWLREEKAISVEPYASASGWRVTICRAYHQDRCDAGGGTCLKEEVIGYNDGGAFEKYEEAAIAGIEYALDNLI
jgi:hypothetical protein